MLAPTTPGKQVLIIEEGTAIPEDLQTEIADSEIIFVPDGTFF
ncbi:hypothetical protein M595_4477 [Lyngbya aestuarii BL J]|uniref:Uncharacterized protein n=1 Tax=Lyngbya aestuarii BL J TaxID=1348334 RepID=U7QEN0_9CYAN|nr:hypothetical protein [Lyngbya aestuarii]ERT05535.1 hypothetical protein M595_4477 [Lyngbya aestuarii BL J]